MGVVNDGECVVTAWAEPASGPGWTNDLVCVLIRDQHGGLRIDYIQPSEHSPDMRALYEVSAVASRAITRAAEASLKNTDEERK